MRLIFGWVGVFLWVGVLSTQAATYYVATNGNDEAAGTLSAPYQTIQHAAIRMSAGDCCQIRGGRYPETISIFNKDNLSFSAYNGETVVLDGSMVITNAWTLYSGNIYKTTLTEDVWELFANGEMMIPARWPNADPNIDLWEQWESEHWAEGRAERSSLSPVDTNGVMYDKPHDGIDLAASGLNLSNAVVVLNVGSFRTGTSIVDWHVPGTNMFTYPAVSTGFKDKEHYYFAEGKLELLDAENEWFFDTVTKELYAWVPGGGSPADLQIKGKKTIYCLTASNCDDLLISGIDFFSGTFNLDDCDRARVENGELTYPSCTRRMLRIIETPQTTEVNSTFAEIYNCTFAYTDGHGIAVSGDDSTVENCYFHHIDYSCANLPSVMPALSIGGDRVTFRNNTLHSFGASVGLLQGNAGTTEYNNFYKGGYKQHDGAMVQVMVAKQTNADIGWNWVHDWSRLGIRFDGAGGSNGLVHHSVGWGPQMNSTVFIGNHENNEIISNSGIYSKSRPEIVVESGGVPAVNNTNTITRNNLARQIAGSTTDGSPVPGIVDHNWDGYDLGMDIRTQLRDPDNLDFRPIPGADIVDAGTNYPGVTDGFVGTAPDIGAYEYGDFNYWIAGYKAAVASIPIPPVGTTDAKGSASLMWLPALDTVSNDVYLGTSSNAVAIATRASPEFMGNVVNNMYNPLGLQAQTTYWRIDSVTATGTVKGDVWSFAALDVSVAPPGIVNTAAACVSGGSVTVGGQITDGGTASRVWIHWWPAGGETNTVDMGCQDYSFDLPISGLITNTTYYYQCQASNTYGTSWATEVESFTTDGAAWVGGTFTNWVELTYDNFENGWGGFVSDGGSAVLHTGGSPEALGNNAVHLNSSDSFTQTSGFDVDAPGYTMLRLEFSLYFQGMDKLDYTYVDVWDGSAWQQVDSFNKTPYGNGNRHSIELLIDESSVCFASDFKVRFRQASGPDDNAYIDEVRLSGREIVTFNTPYDEWSYENGLIGSETNYLTDSDFDGLNNLVEYGLGGNPASNDVVSVFPSIGNAAGTNAMEYIYRRRTDAAVRGLAYWLEESSNLVSNNWNLVVNPEVGTAPLESGFEAVTNRISTTESNRFIRLRISVD